MTKIFTLFIALTIATIGLSQDTWKHIVEPYAGPGIQRYEFYANGTGWFYEDESFKVTTDGGETWTYKSIPRAAAGDLMMDITALDFNNIYSIFGNAQYQRIKIIKYDQENNEWLEVASHTYADHTLNLFGSIAVWCKVQSADFIYGSVRGQNNTTSNMEDLPFVFTNAGSNQMSFRDNISLDFDYVVDIEFFDNKTGLMITRKSSTFHLLKTTNGGTQWTDLGEIAASEYSKVQLLSAQDYIVSHEKELAISADGGSSWSNKTVDEELNYVQTFRFASKTCGLVISRTDNNNYYIFRTNDGGDSWTADVVSEDVPYYNEGKKIYEVKHLGCDSWFAATNGYIISNTDIPFTKASGIDSKRQVADNTFYPNPANNWVMLADEMQKIEIYNTQGQLVHTANNCTRINVSGLPKGNFIFKLYTENSLTISHLAIVR